MKGLVESYTGGAARRLLEASYEMRKACDIGSPIGDEGKVLRAELRVIEDEIDQVYASLLNWRADYATRKEGEK